MTVSLLCVADFHLGQRTRRLPEEVDARACSPVAAFGRLVDVACERKPDAVLLAGDVVDQDNAFFEAFGPLEAGVRRLVQAGIAVIAVAGNHDHEVLRRLADRIPEFTLLGRGGQWEERLIERDGEAIGRVVGWSFPGPHVHESPMARYVRPEASGVPAVGLLHCDVDASGSPYAPVSRAELENAGVSAWVLGHVHAPRVLHGRDPMMLYCGSPQGLDPTETGPHGAWWLRIEDSGEIALERVPVARLRWAALDVPLEAVDDHEGFEKATVEAVRGMASGLGEEGPLLAVGCRLTLTGRSPAYDRVAGWTGDVLDLEMNEAGARVFVDKVHDEAGPALNLSSIAGATDPPGLLAQRLLTLQSGEPAEAYQEMIRRGRERLEAAAGRGTYASLGEPPELDDAEVSDRLQLAGWRLLEALLAQAEEAS